MTRTKTVLRALLGVGAAGAIAAFGTFSAFSSTTDNPGNTIATGSVAISDNDLGVSKLIEISGAKPGTPYERCMLVTYTGTLPASVKMSVPTAVAALAADLDLDVTAGTQPVDPARPFGDCSGFTASAGANLFGDNAGDTLATFRGAHQDWDTGLVHNPGGSWTQGESVAYRFTVNVQEDAPQGASTGAFTVKWEARNQ
jgi:hypothetical protein